MVSTLARVDLGHATRVRTVISGNIMLLITRPKASPNVSDSCVRQREASAALRPLGEVVCQCLHPWLALTGLDGTIPRCRRYRLTWGSSRSRVRTESRESCPRSEAPAPASAGVSSFQEQSKNLVTRLFRVAKPLRVPNRPNVEIKLRHQPK